MEDANSNTSIYKKGRVTAILIIAILFAVGLFQALTGSTGAVTSQIDDRLLGVCGTYGDAVFVELNAIADVQLVDSFDFGTCLEGDVTGNTVSGRYSCDAYPEYTVFAYSKVTPLIVVSHPDGILVFNCSTASLTEKFYSQLVQATGISE